MKHVTLINSGNNNLYYGTTSAVATTTGIPIFPKQCISFKIDNNTEIWVISETEDSGLVVAERIDNG